MTQTRKWSALTVGAALLVVALGWMLLVSPARAETAALHLDKKAQEDANVQAQMDIARLKLQAAEVEEYRAKLAKLEKRIPLSAELPRIIVSLQDVTKDVGVDWLTFDPAPPQPLAGAGPAGAPAPGSTDPDAAPRAGAAAGSTGLYVVAINMTAEGSYAQMEKLLRKIEDLPRAFLVTGVTLKSKGSVAGLPPQLELRLVGQVYTRSGKISKPAAPKAAKSPAPAGGGSVSNTHNLG